MISKPREFTELRSGFVGDGGEGRIIVTGSTRARGRADRVVLLAAEIAAACKDQADWTGWDKAETGQSLGARELKKCYTQATLP